MTKVTWYQLSVGNTFKELGVSELGLTYSEAAARLKKYGYNELKFRKPNIIFIFLRQFHNPLVYILLAAAAITTILTLRGEHMLADTAVIMGVVFLNAVLGFIQEEKTEAALEALNKTVVPECNVIRDGKQKVIPVRELVPGDVLILNGGDRIPADLRLFYAKNVSADEAALTGEALPVGKNTEPVLRPDLPPGDQKDMAFAGTYITRGSARGVVVATGESTEFGKIARMLKSTSRTVTPLQKKIAAFTNTLMVSIIILGIINFLVAYIFGFSLLYSFLASVSLIVAAIPEMLPMLVTSILAMAAANMAKRNALIRRLPAAETLGCTTVICSDKTGTLTRNEMTVLRIYAGGNDYRVSGTGYNPYGEFSLNNKAISPIKGHDTLLKTLTAGFRCNNAALISDKEGFHITGDPTEGALVVAAAKAGIKEKSPRLDEIPFESERMFMAVLYKQTENNIIYVKGSPEIILNMCLSQLTDSGIAPLRADEVKQKANEMAQESLRILGMAYRNVPTNKKILQDADISGMTFLGLQGMADPPRAEVIEAIQKCKKAGIRPIMITGDHALTAKAIASQLGMQTGENGVVTGEELSRMSDEELGEALNTISVFARVSPEHKLRIAQQLQEKGQIVAMTGDGVNDAPALRAADIGIAMGKTGTDVSKGAAAMVLTDDNFASIVAAVEEGRHAWNNLETAILFTLPTNGGQALLVMGAILLAPFIPLLAMRLPLEPIQILWVNLFDSVFLSMPLMMEPREKGLLDMPPRNPNGKIANGIFFERVGLVSLLMAAVGIAAYWYFGHTAIAVSESLLTQAQTAALMSVVMFHCGYVITARSIYKSAFSFSPFSNKWLLAGIMIALITNLMIVYIPFMNSIFRTVPFPTGWWPYVMLGIPAGFLPLELEKFLRRKLKK